MLPPLDATRAQHPHPARCLVWARAALRPVEPGALPHDALALLRVAAIAGQELTAERAARMLGCTLLDLAEQWSALEAADVLRGNFFSHDLMHKAALRTVAQGVGEALHRQFAALLAEDGSVSPARLAVRWEQGKRMTAPMRTARAGAHTVSAARRPTTRVPW
jgi:hypothetical protein